MSLKYKLKERWGGSRSKLSGCRGAWLPACSECTQGRGYLRVVSAHRGVAEGRGYLRVVSAHRGVAEGRGYLRVVSAHRDVVTCV